MSSSPVVASAAEKKKSSPRSRSSSNSDLPRPVGPLRTFSNESTPSVDAETWSLQRVIYGPSTSSSSASSSRFQMAKSDVFTSERDGEEEAAAADDDNKSNNKDLLDDIAPVSSKWSDSSSSSFGLRNSNGSDNGSCGIVSVEDELDERHIVNIKLLRKMVSAGRIEIDDDVDQDQDETDAPSSSSHRAVAWRLLMGYLPPDLSQWKSTMLERRKVYAALVHNMFADIADAHTNSAELTVQRQQRRGRGDTPNSPSPHGGTAPANNFGASSSSSSLSAAVRQYTHRQKVIQTTPVIVLDYWKQHQLDERILDRAITDDINALRMDNLMMDSGTTANNNNVSSSSSREESNNEDETNAAGDENLNNDVPPDESSSSSTPPIGVVVDHQGSLPDFAESAQLLEEIRKDVIRTHPDLAFFLEPYQNLGRRRHAALERILFLWSKYNKGVRYVQGMNEIVGIIYYVLANDNHAEWSEWAEADTYWIFNALLVEMSDVFVAGKDEAATGIRGRILAMQSLLARHDPEVREHLDELGIETSFYAIRWWTTLLSREFLLPDVIRLWDSMFASTHKDNFLRFACVTMVMKVRDGLLRGDFATCLRLLHDYPCTDVESLLESSRALYIYESQVTLACHRGGLTLHQALTSIRSPPSLLMAFGFAGGTPPVTRAEQLERAKSSVEAGVRGVFGRASKLYNTWYQTDQKKEKQQAVANNQALALGRKDDDDSTMFNRSRSFDSADDVYLSAFRSD
jgi:hypothetical protein